MRRRPTQSGFTLVEVVVATVVLAIGLLAALTAFSMATHVVGVSTTETTASFLAQQKLAQVQASDAAHLQARTTTGDFGSAYPDYFWELTVHRADPLHVVRVDLTIYAPEAGKTRAFRFSTAVF